MALVNPPQNDKRRVKVYELRNNDWFDRGTGFCSGQVVNVSTVAAPMRSPFWQGLVDMDQLCHTCSYTSLDRMSPEYTSNRRTNQIAYFWRRKSQKKMGSRSNRVIMRAGWGKQKADAGTATLIVWTESGTDMALSFQEGEGCAAIWSVWQRVQCLPGILLTFGP